MIDVRNLSIRFGSHLVIDNISFSLDRGSDMVILGHHGAGKTSILNWIFGQVKGSGEMIIDQVKMSNPTSKKLLKSGVCLVPEEGCVFPDLTVRENLLFSQTLINSGEPIPQNEGFFKNLHHLLDTKAYSLSGGQTRMLSILMGMVRKPKYLFLDEPFAGLSKDAIDTFVQQLKILKSQNVGVVITGEFDNIQYSEFTKVLKL
jgi:ABC-type branched-subunit amino acid transport system ATPase component